jgi:hypothetical protein
MSVSFIKDLYRVTLNLPGVGATVFSPQNEVIRWKWARHKDYRQFILTCETELLFVDHESFSIDDFTKLYDLERDAGNRCEAIDCLIERSCNEGFTTLFQGYLALIDGEWDVSRCRVTIQPRIYDPYECLEEVSKEVVNVLEASAGDTTILSVTKNTVPCNGTFHAQVGYTDQDVVDWLQDNNCVSGPGWALVSYEYEEIQVSGSNVKLIVVSEWERYEYVVECDGMGVAQPPTSSGGWTLISDDCGSNGTSTWVSETGGSNVFLDRGRKLEDVLNLMLDDCDLTIVSDFFNINPDGTAPDNAAYQQAAIDLLDLRIVQITDVKFSIDGPPDQWARKGEMRLKELLDDLKGIFNADYIIDGSTLRIEHVSYFETYTFVTDFTQPKWSKYIAGAFKYTYRTDRLPKSENFAWAEEHDYRDADFLGYPIIYGTVCSVNNDGKDEQFKTNYFLTDWSWVERNTRRQNEATAAGRSSGLKEISDDLFLLVSTENAIVNVSQGFNSGISKVNAALAWANLHQYYHKIGRPHTRGEMNNQEQDFETFNYPREQEEFEVNMCCDNLFDFSPDDEKYRTQIGWGRVSEATYEDPRQVMTFNLEHKNNG